MTFRPEPIDIATWPAIYAVLAPAIARSDATLTELLDDLLSSSAQLWVKREGGDPVACAVSELETEPRGHIVHGRLLAGARMTEWVDELIDCIAAHARQIGAVGITIEGRRGWERVLGRKGWQRRAVIMELAL